MHAARWPKRLSWPGGRNGAAEAVRVLDQGVGALRVQGEVLDQRLQATGQQANQTGWQAETVAQGIKEMMPAARSLEGSLRIHADNMSRINRNHRWRRWLTGFGIAAASFVFFVLGRGAAGSCWARCCCGETDVVSFGDPRQEWNDFVLEEYAPTIAGCASWARLNQETIRCQLYLDPSLEVTIPLYPDATVEEVPSDESAAPSAWQ